MLGAAALVGLASADHVTVAPVTPHGGQTVSIDDRQALWVSPCGGWGVTTWPFGLSVDETTILAYPSAWQNLVAAAGEGTEPADRVLGREMCELTGEDQTVRPEGTDYVPPQP